MAFFVEGLNEHSKAQVRRIGEYETLAEAITAAQKTIEGFLLRWFKAGMDSKTLFLLYRARGEYPFIFRDDDPRDINVDTFDHINCAMALAAQICKVSNRPSDFCLYGKRFQKRAEMKSAEYAPDEWSMIGRIRKRCFLALGRIKGSNTKPDETQKQLLARLESWVGEYEKLNQQGEQHKVQEPIAVWHVTHILS